jgi:hypothetical protein
LLSQWPWCTYTKCFGFEVQLGLLVFFRFAVVKKIFQSLPTVIEKAFLSQSTVIAKSLQKHPTFILIIQVIPKLF